MEEKNYTFEAGDSLSAIAEKYLGSVGNFRELATHNNLDIFAPLIGKTLKIPTIDQVAAMVQGAVSKNNISPNSAENILKDLDLSGLRIANEKFGILPHQLISWIFQ